MSKFRLNKSEVNNFNTPQEMYDDYKNKKIEGIYDYQSKMIDLYMKNADTESDIALELPTGTGKTLVGLLISEFRRRKYNEKVIYLCPNNQLVNQVLEYSTEYYGIKAVGFTGSAKEYNPKDKSRYLTGKAIAITNYSSLFNTNPFFQDPDIIVFDDAHSGESYISSNWTVTIDRNKNPDLYYDFTETVKEIVDELVYEKMNNNNPDRTDLTWVDLIPNIKLLEKHLDIQMLINNYINENDTDIRYSWTNIRDNLFACNLFLSWKKIVVRPYISPTQTLLPFKNAKHRIYMSATLGKSGELERAFGIPKVTRLPMVKDWKNKTIGRKYFMFPTASFKLDQVPIIIKKITEITNRVLMIVKDNDTQDLILKFLKDNIDVDTFIGKDIEKSKEEFISSEQGFAVIANRFDGIDFPNDECRMLILLDLPNATHIQEKFLITRMAAMTLFEERINTRVVQALGRCTRTNTDYAAVCIIGDDLMNSLLSPTKMKQFNPELQSEILFGSENSENKESLEEYLELLDIFLNNRHEWEDAEYHIIRQRDIIIEKSEEKDNIDYQALMNSSRYEVKAQYDIWKKDFNSALDNIENIVAKLKENSLKGYKGFWLYIAAYCAYNIYKSGDCTYKNIYKEYLQKASKTTISISWLNQLIDFESKDKTINNGMEYVIENIEKEIMKASKVSHYKFHQDLESVIKLLSSDDGIEFEKGHERLGELLGYKTFNPKGDAEPDPIWVLNEKYCIVSEDKIYESTDKPITTRHARQAAGHINWVNKNSKELSMINKPKSITIFITNTSNIDKAASIQGDDIYYLDRDDFVKFANRCVCALKDIRKNFSNEGDVIWREKVIEKFISSRITPSDFINMIMERKISELTIK